MTEMSARPRRQASVPAAPGFTALLPVAVICAALLVGYFNTFKVPFLMDDDGAVLKNPSVWKLWDLKAVLWPPDNMTTAGRPLLNLSFAINYALQLIERRRQELKNI